MTKLFMTGSDMITNQAKSIGKLRVALVIISLSGIGLLGFSPANLTANQTKNNSSRTGNKAAETQKGKSKKATNKPASADRNKSKNTQSKTANAKKTPPRRTPNRKWMPGVTPEREAAVITFVRGNHPELEAVLDRLRVKNKREYQQAIRDLFRVSERLTQYQERGQVERYQLELKIWQAQSRAFLLAAKFKVADAKKRGALKKQLERELNTQIELRLEGLKRDRAKQAERLRKLDAQIERMAAAQQRTVERQYRLLTTAKKTARKPGTRTKTEKVSVPPTAATKKKSKPSK